MRACLRVYNSGLVETLTLAGEGDEKTSGPLSMEAVVEPQHKIEVGAR